MKYSLSEINEVIRNRRSIYPKQFSDRPVHKEQIKLLLENARWAPTHKMTEPWRFKVFMGNGRSKLAEFHAQAYKGETAPDKFLERKYEKIRFNVMQSSAVIAIIMKRDPEHRVPEEEEVCSVACAVQNMHLTATAYGIGLYWGSGGMTRSESMKKFLGLDEEDRCLGFLYIGYPKGDWPRKTLRNEPRLFTEWVEE